MVLNAQLGRISSKPASSETHETKERAYRHHADLWYLDGNIVLCSALEAGSDETDSDSQTRVLYKVHKGILASCSVVFSGMFFGGDTVAFNIGSEQYEGLPLMEMPDSVPDLEAFLSAVYIPR